MRKWEEKYEKLKNGEFDARIDELKSKIDDKKATREEFKEYEKLSKSKGNISKVENVMKYRDESKLFLEEVKKELEARENMKKATEETKKIEEELAEIMKELDSVSKSLKNKDLTPEEKSKLEEKKSELKDKRNENDKKYLENQALLKTGLTKNEKLKNYNEEDLKNLKLKTSSRISKCNMVANSLVNGLSWDSIDLKLDNWDKNKKFTNKGKKLSEKDKSNDKTNETKEDDEKIDIISSEEKFKENEELRKNKKEKSEFETKHPRLAKIRNWFRKNILKKEDMLPEGKEEEQPKEKNEVKNSEESFKDYIKFVAEYGHKNARKEQLKSNKELRDRYEAMKEANRKAEEKKFGKDYADMSRTTDDDGR